MIARIEVALRFSPGEHAGVRTNEGLIGRWRRLDRAVQALVAADATSSHELVTDALVDVLDKLYPLWETWGKACCLDASAQNAAVSGNGDGEIAAALALARTETTHDLVEPGRSSAYGEGVYGEGTYGLGLWRLRPLSLTPTKRVWKVRATWYAQHCSGQHVVAVVAAARRWAGARPELR